MITNHHSRSGAPVAIVTSGSQGIGRAVARKLATADYGVVISYLNSQPAADAAVEEDRNRILEGAKLARKMSKSAQFKNMIVKELNPWQADTDEQVMDSIKTTIESYAHPFASAPMGPEGSKSAVVDLKGKVYKTTNLRVIDASIFPDVVSAAPNPTVIMMAERLADEIKNGN